MEYTNVINRLPSKDKIPSPTLIYYKWQGYDDFTEFTTKLASNYLAQVLNFVQEANIGQYSRWHREYMESIQKAGAINLNKIYYTNWRLIVGMGTNPTLETGIQLHHLYGFPYIPGSAVKGLLHHVAELELCDDTNWKIEENEKLVDLEKSDKWQSFLKALHHAELVRILFGSLFIEKGEYKKKNKNGEEKKYYSGLETPLEWFSKWQKKLPDKKKFRDILDRIKAVTSDEATGGMLTFFDAVPAENAFNNGDLLQLDIMNPHYQKYYSDEKDQIPPSDDQDPNPIYFLAVKPNTEFIFPFRIADFPVGDGRDDPEEERVKVLKDFTRNQIEQKVTGWLKKGLTEWGAGAKTAAGYGYFK